ncbi:MAG: hypothetical protein WCG99_00455 [Candidatus Berkelbacteria bacterium]
MLVASISAGKSGRGISHSNCPKRPSQPITEVIKNTSAAFMNEYKDRPSAHRKCPIEASFGGPGVRDRLVISVPTGPPGEL